MQRLLVVALELGKVGCPLPPAYRAEAGDQVRAVFDGAAAPSAQIADRQVFHSSQPPIPMYALFAHAHAHRGIL